MAGYPGNAAPADEGRPLFQNAYDPGQRDDDDDNCCGPPEYDSGPSFWEENRACLICTAVILTIISVILLAFSFDVVKPTEYGLLQNGWTQWVYTDYVYPPGRHFVWFRNFFITVPAYRVNVEFSTAATANSPPVPGRTGRDLSDPDSGGQPVTLSFSFQYQFKQNDVGKVYTEFAEQYEARYLLFARMAVSDVAQEFTPNKFWSERSKIAAKMFEALKVMLRDKGHCDVTGFQLLQVDFPTKYEDMITDIQLQVQYKLTSEYQQQVTNVMKNIDVLTAMANAEITEVNADAQAKASLMVNQATVEGFKLEQAAKAKSYASMQKDLGLTNQEMLEYVKIKSLTSARGGLGTGSKTVLGTSQPSLVFS